MSNSGFVIPNRYTYGEHAYQQIGEMLNCYRLTRSSAVMEKFSIDLKPIFQTQCDSEEDAMTLIDDLGKSDPEYRK